MRLSGYVPSQIIPKSRVVHLADKQILKRHILCYPKITVSDCLQKSPGGGGGGGGGGRVSDTWPMADYQELCESRSGYPGLPVPNKPTVSVDVKQDSTRRQYYQHTHTHTQIKSDTLVVKLYRVAAMSQSQIFTVKALCANCQGCP